MTVRSDNRLENGPMVPVSCQTCGVVVQARKSSWEQTTLQWSHDGQQHCLERRAYTAGTGPNDAAFRGCAALRDSVRAAVETGRLPVQDADPLKENSEHEAPTAVETA